MNSKNSFYVSGSVIIVLVIIIISIGNRVSDEVFLEGETSQGDYLIKEFSYLSPTVEDYDIWPDIFDKTAVSLGFENFAVWEENNGSVSPLQFDDQMKVQLRSNAKWTNDQRSPVSLYESWMEGGTKTPEQFMMEFDLNPLTFFFWKIYVLFYTL
jgi:hypothetical protein